MFDVQGTYPEMNSKHACAYAHGNPRFLARTNGVVTTRLIKAKYPVSFGGWKGDPSAENEYFDDYYHHDNAAGGLAIGGRSCEAFTYCC